MSKEMIRKRYAKIATSNESCCGSALKGLVKNVINKVVKPGGCCGSPVESPCGGTISPRSVSKQIGYSDEEMNSVPDGANLGLGCGNPVALAALKEGDVVLDLGSGAGFDCFLAAKKVGDKGRVIGVDMTPEMIDKARENVAKSGLRNVEFRLGEIEALPLEKSTVDAVISNCVINLSLDKKKVFQETHRVLKPGGRLMVSDIVLLKSLPEKIKQSVEAYVGCVAGALLKSEYIGAIKEAGFEDIRIISETTFPIDFLQNDPTLKSIIEDGRTTLEELKEIGKSVVSMKISATKIVNVHLT